jgi:hypothetical protein
MVGRSPKTKVKMATANGQPLPELVRQTQPDSFEHDDMAVDAGLIFETLRIQSERPRRMKNGWFASSFDFGA